MTDQTLPTFSVSDLIASLNQTLEFAYPTVVVEGEVMSFKVNQQKYVFFDLKDSSGSLGCFMTLWQLRMPIEDGMKVVVQATPKITAWGKFSLTVQSIRPSGEGSLKKSFELLKAKLDKEGLFAAERKRRLPAMPSHIAVISSTQAAGYADFIKILNDRWGGLQVEVAHTQVQGADAPDQIMRAIKYFNEQQELPEALVIIRGGGSADDLAAFYDEQLVRAIAASRIPVITGIGHEVDESLADLVADVRAATPSNVAQILVPDKREIAADAKHVIRRIATLADNHVQATSNDIARMMVRTLEKVDARRDSVEAEFKQLQRVLEAVDPRAVLKRGYAIIRGHIAVGQQIEIEQYDTVIKAEVTDVSKR